MLASLPADMAICAAAVADWRPEKIDDRKMKKRDHTTAASLNILENPDILRTLAHSADRRPHLVVGFAAETNDIIKNAVTKRNYKGCDWIIANDVSSGTNTFGSDENKVHFITENVIEDWPLLAKTGVADRLVDRITEHFKTFARAAE